MAFTKIRFSVEKFQSNAKNKKQSITPFVLVAGLTFAALGSSLVLGGCTPTNNGVSNTSNNATNNGVVSNKTDASLSVTSYYLDISFCDTSEIILQIIKRLTKIIIISSMLSSLLLVLFVIAKLISGQICTLLVTTWMQTDRITNRNK